MRLPRSGDRITTPIRRPYTRPGACDYDDILLDLLRLLEADAAVREQVRARFPYLLIDEFQDLNAAQYRLVLQLAGEGAGLMAIGDPDQAIYSFRGASPAISPIYARTSRARSSST